MAITVDTTTSKDAGNTSSSTLSHTCAADATMLVVCIAADSAAAPTGITYNGVAMTQQKRVTGLDTTVWTLASPASGPNNIVVSFATSHYFAITAMSLKGTEVSSYIDGAGNTGSGSTNDAAISVTTSSANSIVIAAGAHNRASSRTAIASNTIQKDQYVTTDNFYGLLITRSTTTAGAYSVGWTMGTPGDGWWSAAIAIKEAATVSATDAIAFGHFA